MQKDAREGVKDAREKVKHAREECKKSDGYKLNHFGIGLLHI